MKNRIGLAIVLLTIGLLTGCASTPGRDINDPGNSLVFGYIDMDDAPTSISGADIQQISPPTDSPYWGMGVKNGLFLNSYLPLGSYQMSSFSGSGFFAGEHRYSFSRQGNQINLRITKPGIYFIGAFKFKKIKTGIFEQGRFSIEKTSKPGEAELLQRILDENSEIRESAWGNKIRARLSVLKK